MDYIELITRLDLSLVFLARAEFNIPAVFGVSYRAAISQNTRNYCFVQGAAKVLFAMWDYHYLELARNLFTYLAYWHYSFHGLEPTVIQGKTVQIAILSIIMLNISLVLHRSYSNRGRSKRTQGSKETKGVSKSFCYYEYTGESRITILVFSTFTKTLSCPLGCIINGSNIPLAG